MGEHRGQLMMATAAADATYWFEPAGMGWSLASLVAESPVPATVVSDVDDLVAQVGREVRPGDQVVVMSNGGFGGIHQKLLDHLQDASPL
jgi:UDP-N-acetylmuramate: L-alanyl-gamma-D-glutamyl-meso-diaminopimelate ligase